MNWLMLSVLTQTFETEAAEQRGPLKASFTAQLLWDHLIHPPLSQMVPRSYQLPLSFVPTRLFSNLADKKLEVGEEGSCGEPRARPVLVRAVRGERPLFWGLTKR